MKIGPISRRSAPAGASREAPAIGAEHHAFKERKETALDLGGHQNRSHHSVWATVLAPEPRNSLNANSTAASKHPPSYAPNRGAQRDNL